MLAFAGKNTWNWQVKTPAIAGKNTLNCRQKYPKFQERIRTIAVKNTRNCRQYCYHAAGKITCQLRVRLNPAGESNRKLRFYLRVVACILREVLAA